MENWFGLSLTPAQWAWFAVIGILTGVINTLAGSGSLITLPVFMFVCGMPAPLANGTNRIGAFLQSGLGAIAFWRTNPDAFRHSAWVVWPSILGSIAGSIAATKVDEYFLNVAIAVLMLFMLGILLVNPNRWIRESKQKLERMRNWKCFLIFVAIGFYGGFIQAGVGIFLLAALVLAAHYNLKDGNAIKLTVVTAICIPSIVTFALSGQIDFGLGLAMAFFQMIGAVLAVVAAARIPNINVHIHRLLLIMVAGSAIEMIRQLFFLQSQQ